MKRVLVVVFVSLVCAPALAYEGGTFAKPASQPVQKAPELTKNPAVRTYVPARYPEEERGKGNLEVVLILYLDAEGNVTKAVVQDKEKIALAFVTAAEEAALQLKFIPGEIDNKPAAMGIYYRYTFTDDIASTQPSSSLASEPASSQATAEAPASQPKKVTYGTAVLKIDVREAGTRSRLPGVVLRVQVADLDIEGMTDDKGRCEFRDLPLGPAKLTLTSPQHRARTMNYKLEKNVETGEKVYLQRAWIDPFETIVQGKRDQREVTKRVISREELIKVPGSFGDPLRAIQNMPGVARPPLIGGNLVIRGSSPNSSEFYIDGMKLPALYHFGQGPSVIQESLIEDITFLPCCFSTRYGRATAGIIEVTTRKPNYEKWSGKASLDFGIVRLFTEIPVTENTIIDVGFRRSLYDLFLPLVFRLANPPVPGQIQNPTLIPVFYDYQARLVHKTKNIGEFQLFIFGSDDRLKFVQTPTQQTSAFNPAELEVGLDFHAIQPMWTLKLSPEVTNTLALQVEFEINSANTPDVFFRLNEFNLGLREEIRYKPYDWLSFILGTDIQYNRTWLRTKLPLLPRFPQFPNPGTESPPFTNFDNVQDTIEAGVYVEAEMKLGRLKLLPGIRAENISYVGRARQAFMPRLSAKLKVAEPLDLKAAVGVFQKRPEALNIIQDFGNPDLQLMSALHTTLGFEWNITQALSLEMSGFFNYLWDEPGGSSRVRLTNGNIQPLLFENNTIGRVYGGELLLRHKPYKNFFGWIAYTLSRSERKTDGDWFLFGSDQTHIFIVVASYILPYGFQVGARFRVVSGNPGTPVVGSVWDSDTGSYRRVNGAFRSTRLPTFHQLDLRVDKKFTFNTWWLTVYVDVQNVYNHQNAEFFQYSFDFSKQQYFSGLPVLPVLGLEAEW
ncbi:MAG: TonB-dependent receptor plug domain-containing protein [Deltaproteobacteria bacterium]|nr:TonB-dependent receptor plug domain-containing protein [Deltaproteobacteria bacterium]